MPPCPLRSAHHGPPGHLPWVSFPSSRPFVVPPSSRGHANSPEASCASASGLGTLRSGLMSPSAHGAQGCAGDWSQDTPQDLSRTGSPCSPRAQPTGETSGSPVALGGEGAWSQTWPGSNRGLGGPEHSLREGAAQSGLESRTLDQPGEPHPQESRSSVDRGPTRMRPPCRPTQAK